jgi:hypothetical protein
LGRPWSCMCGILRSTGTQRLPGPPISRPRREAAAPATPAETAGRRTLPRRSPRAAHGGSARRRGACGSGWGRTRASAGRSAPARVTEEGFFAVAKARSQRRFAPRPAEDVNKPILRNVPRYVPRYVNLYICFMILDTNIIYIDIDRSRNVPRYVNLRLSSDRDEAHSRF